MRAHTKEIGGKVYMVDSLSAWDGFGVGQQLISLFGGPLGALSTQDTSQAFRDIAKGLGSQEFRGIVQKLLENMRVDGRLLTRELFEAHFCENYGELTELIAFALQVNFASLFSTRLGVALRRFTEAAMRDQSTPQTASPTGDSRTSSGGGPS